MSLPEVLLWNLLRKKPGGVKFRRQHPVGPYVIDFYCPSAKLGFEIDGSAHDMGDRPEKDAERDTWLAGQGIEIVRIPASAVLKSDVEVAAAILRRCGGLG
ncbi:endonuclease domain-containing protein [Novosphingobium sp.]|uniref:endonuclease domain-containing protein n=1 Tax=Novosphingobium sp. TaxID=1874826 RepID=UPI00286E1A91|nr:endonuclease domain-containing protein [Novosphingobium sp.]